MTLTKTAATPERASCAVSPAAQHLAVALSKLAAKSSTTNTESFWAANCAFLAKVARKRSPVDKMWYGFTQEGTEFNPTRISQARADCADDGVAADNDDDDAAAAADGVAAAAADDDDDADSMLIDEAGTAVAVAVARSSPPPPPEGATAAAL